MTALQIVFAATVAVVAVAVALVVSGVAILAGLGWAMICAGVLLTVTAVTTAVVLLRDEAKK